MVRYVSVLTMACRRCSDGAFDMAYTDSRMDIDVMLPVGLSIAVDALHLVHNMACQRNLQLLAIMKQQMMDLHRPQHMAMSRQYADAYLSFDDFETTPLQVK